MKFYNFAKILVILEQSSSRNEMTEILAGFLQALDTEEVRPVMYMLTGRIAPKFIPLEFNFSTKLLLRGLEKASDIGIGEIENLMAEKGDVGLVAEELALKQKRKVDELEIKVLFEKLTRLASLEGSGSQSAKIGQFAEIYALLDPVSIKYVSRMIVGKLRLGLNDKTILDSLSWAAFGDKSYRKQLDYSYGVRADIGDIGELVLEKRLEELEALAIEPGTPVSSKLVERDKSVEAVFERIPKSIIQPKYDGLRLQIHYSKSGFEDEMQLVAEASTIQFNLGQIDSAKDSKVRIFSRNMEPLTDMFPDVVAEIEGKADRLPEAFVLDAEAIGYDPDTGKYTPFQETIKRKRKYGVKEKSESVPVKVHVFDILYTDKEDISQKAFSDRLEQLEKLSNGPFGNSNILEASESLKIDSLEEMEKVFVDYLGEGLEGVIVKDPESKYLPGTRNFDWIKLKANINSKLVDTIDAVVLGYYYGTGARAKHGIGAFLVGVYNEELDRFESIAKVGSGIKDDEWEQIVKDLEEVEANKLSENVEIKKELMPDVLVEPKIVVVVEADEITKSKLHTAGQDKKGVGYSLRFPRLKEWNRQDKDPEQISNVSEIASLA
ncbi:ATP-dependent DNA ligase [Candidatus Dojkabacteria bacterium]|nr:ATP-dependent DNA ligase [Candidatus Dojkabacteria bacterium]